MISAAERLLSRCATGFAYLRSHRDVVVAWQGLWVLVDQAIVSLANFLTVVIIGRFCMQRELGLYDLLFTTVVLLQGIPKALIWTPYTSGSPHRHGAQLARYTGSVSLHLLAISVMGSAGLAIIGGLFALTKGGGDIGRLLMLLAPLLVLFMIREHVRRIALAWLEIKEAVVMDAAVSLLQVAGVLWLGRTGWLNAASAIVVIAMANATAALWLFIWKRREDVVVRISDAYVHGAENWSFSKWLLPGAVLTLLCDSMYRWFVPLSHGLGSLGIFVASMSLIRVLNPVILGLANWGTPLFASTYAREGIGGLSRLARKATGLLLGLILFCLPLFIIWGGLLVELLFGDRYHGTGPVVTALALGMLVHTLLLPVDSALLALRQGKFLLGMVALRLLLTCTVGLLLTIQFGPIGAGYGMFLSSAAVLVADWAYFTKLTRRDQRLVAVTEQIRCEP